MVRQRLVIAARHALSECEGSLLRAVCRIRKTIVETMLEPEREFHSIGDISATRDNSLTCPAKLVVSQTRNERSRALS